MSDFEYQPSYGAQVESAPRVLSARFGDGYEQRVGDGINTDLARWSLTFTRVAADITAIAAFLSLKAGITAFTWTPDGESEITVVCRQWTRGRIANGLQTLSATFEQVMA